MYFYIDYTVRISVSRMWSSVYRLGDYPSSRQNSGDIKRTRRILLSNILIDYIPIIIAMFYEPGVTDHGLPHDAFKVNPLSTVIQAIV